MHVATIQGWSSGCSFNSIKYSSSIWTLYPDKYTAFSKISSHLEILLPSKCRCMFRSANSSQTNATLEILLHGKGLVTTYVCTHASYMYINRFTIEGSCVCMCKHVDLYRCHPRYLAAPSNYHCIK